MIPPTGAPRRGPAGGAAAGQTAAVPVWTELRTAVAGVDPGWERLRLAAIGSASMVLAVAVMAGVRAATGGPVTLLIFAAVLAMIANLAVNEPDLRRRRGTTALMVGPAAVSVVAGTLLSPHRLAADAAFVAVTVAAVYVRRFGPRGFALGMAGFMPFFFTQFLAARPAELPWLLLAAATGIASTLLLRGYVFAERDERTLARLLRAFRAHVHALLGAVAGALAAAGGPARRVEAAVRDGRRRWRRLNATALLLADQLDRRDGGGPDGGGARDGGLAERVLDVQLAAERLAIATRRLAEAGGPHGDDRDALLGGLRGLGTATATGTPHAAVPALLDGSRHAVAARVARTGAGGGGDTAGRSQRVAFAVHRLADVLEAGTTEAGRAEHATEADRAEHLARGGPAGPTAGGSTAGGSTADDRPGGRDSGPGPDHDPDDTRDPDGTRDTGDTGDTDGTGDTGDPDDPDAPRTLRPTTRQALQAGTAVGLSIVVGELVSPSRWYWAAIAAFVVFAGTESRGDILSRGWQRTLGTAGGVAAGMGLALLVGGRTVPALAALAACLFLALYLVRVSPALMAFWITAVLALMYGLIGQFSLQTLVLRIEETAVGSLMGVLAAYLVLPRRTRDAYAEARDALLEAAAAALAAAADQLLGRQPAAPPVELARAVDDALGTLRARTAPLTGPLVRRAGGYRDTVRALAGVDHYTRAFARFSDEVRAPDWAPVLQPAVDRVRDNLDGLAGTPRATPDEVPVRSAEHLVDAAEEWAARCGDPARRRDLLEAARLLRRIDQSALALLPRP